MPPKISEGRWHGLGAAIFDGPALRYPHRQAGADGRDLRFPAPTFTQFLTKGMTCVPGGVGKVCDPSARAGPKEAE